MGEGLRESGYIVHTAESLFVYGIYHNFVNWLHSNIKQKFQKKMTHIKKKNLYIQSKSGIQASVLI